MNARTVIQLCWVLFFGYWTLAGLSVKETKEKLGPGALFRYRLFVVGSFVLLIGALPYWPFDIQLWPANGTLDVAGAALAVTGVSISIWSRRTLAGNWSSSVTFKEQHELIVRGPYRFARHPIYTGLIIMMIGTTLSLGRLDSLIGLMIRTIHYVFKYRSEEALMLRHFPHDYPGYMKRVRALFPLP